MVAFSIPLEPVPASRPRVSRWGVYYAPTYKNWLKSATDFLAKQDIRAPAGHVDVTVEMIVTKPRTSKLLYPNFDTDNGLKATLDAITKAGIWRDDKYVVTQTATRRFAKADEPACTKVTIHGRV